MLQMDVYHVPTINDNDNIIHSRMFNVQNANRLLAGQNGHHRRYMAGDDLLLISPSRRELNPFTYIVSLLMDKETWLKGVLSGSLYHHYHQCEQRSNGVK
jgi:hypothetical protein